MVGSADHVPSAGGRRRPRLRRGAALVLAGLFLLSACGDDGAGAGGDATTDTTLQRSGTFVAALSEVRDDFDPIKSGATREIPQSLVYDALIGVDLQGIPDKVTGLANDWTYSADNTTLTVKLRSARFSNGQPVTASDVKFSIERVLSPTSVTSWAASFRLEVGTIDAVDATHVRFNLKKPAALFHYRLTRLDGQEAFILPKAYVEATPDFNLKPIGSGPYKVTSIRPGQEITYEANADYWRGKPAYDKVIYRQVTEAATRIAQLKTGEADFIDVPRDLADATERDGFNVIGSPATGHIELWLMNQWDGIFADKRVREAMDLAIDRQAIIKTIFAGRASMPNYFPMFPSAVGYTGPATLPYDVAKARQLIKDAGAEGKLVTINNYGLSGIAEAPTMLQAVANFWEAIGLKTQIVTTDYNTQIRPRMAAKDPTLVNNVGWMRDAPLKFVASTVRILGHSTGTLSLHRDPVIDKFVTDMEAAPDEDAYKKLVVDLTKYMADNHLRTPIAEAQQLFAANPKKIAKSYDMGKYTSDTFLHDALL